MKRFVVIIGNFGSGKTELALNMAFSAAGRGERVTLVDIDVINPYFRSTDRKTELASAGIKLISPNFTSSGVEAPSLPAEVFSAFLDNSDLVIFDAGGDPVGSIALGQYYAYFKQVEHLEVYYVINIRRPLSSGVEENIEMLDKIRGVSRLNVTGLVNNTNLAHETTVDDLIEGYQVTESLSRATGIPIVAVIGVDAALAEFVKYAKEAGIRTEDIMIMPITRYMHRDWDTYTNKGL